MGQCKYEDLLVPTYIRLRVVEVILDVAQELGNW